jgi:hypothetical protein
MHALQQNIRKLFRHILGITYKMLTLQSKKP